MEGKVLPYKLAWADEANSDFLNSIMFEKSDEALNYAKEKKLKTYLLFKLKTNDNGNYSWELLPEGSYYSYKLGVEAKNFTNKYGIAILIAGILSYIAINSIKKNP